MLVALGLGISLGHGVQTVMVGKSLKVFRASYVRWCGLQKGQQTISQRRAVATRISLIGRNTTEIFRAPAMIADHARQAAGHGFIDHQAPGFAMIARQDEAIRRDVSLGYLRLIEKTREGSGGEQILNLEFGIWNV